jgi:uncharacterized RDD family membrane protein YckC
VTVICDRLELDPEDPKKHTAINPRVLVEVLSPSTEDYDRGEKLGHYKTIPSVAEVMLVAHDRREVEIVRREADGSWSRQIARDGDVARLQRADPFHAWTRSGEALNVERDPAARGFLIRSRIRERARAVSHYDQRPAPPHPTWTNAYPPAIQTRYARFWIRFWARVIDALVGMVLGFLVGFVVHLVIAIVQRPAAIAPHHHLGLVQGLKAASISMAIGVIGTSGYHFACEWIGGATLGKLLLGLRVRDVGLGRCTARGAILRTIAYYVDGLFAGLVAWAVMQESETNQRLGDKWGRTVVVEAASVPASDDDAARLVAGLSVAIALWVLVAVVQSLVQSELFTNL